MKYTLLCVWTFALFFTKNTLGSTSGSIHAPLDIISLEDITPEERRQIALFEQKLGRPKRSGSGDILGALKNAIGQGIKKKVGQIARASASASAHFSSSSSGGGGHSYHYPESPPESYDHKSLDFWSLKKSILNTLLQAVKAIKGGVIAVKGQLIKGSGKLISGSGKLISYKGDAITNLGKNIATSAVLVPYHGHHSSGHKDYGYSETHYSAPSAPEEIYHGYPSASGGDYHVPEHYPPPHHGGADGLLIVKKIQGGNHHKHVEDVPPFKPVESSGPSFGSIIGKFLWASSSLDPHQPEPFGDTASADIHPESHHSESHFYHHDSHDNEISPSAAGLAIHGKGNIVDHEKSEQPSTSYGTPFEEAPSYLNHNLDFVGSSSKNSAKVVKNPKTKENSAPIWNTINPIENNRQKDKSIGNSQVVDSNQPPTSSSNSNSLGYSPENQNLISYLSPTRNTITPTKNSDDTILKLNIDNYQVIPHSDPNQPAPSSLSYNPNFLKYPSYNKHFVVSNNKPDFNSPNPTASQDHSQVSYQMPFMQEPYSPNSSPIAGSNSLPNIADYPDGFPPSLQYSSTGQSDFDQRHMASELFKQTFPNPTPIVEPLSSPSPYLESPKATFFLPTPNAVVEPSKLRYSTTTKLKYRTPMICVIRVRTERTKKTDMIFRVTQSNPSPELRTFRSLL
ncbi:hypothetical protein JTB14_024778 [Gonioctena quinquepunctata]|nr:hypothetical protein JTB14_024778 [Gonioctena quinquepunctata]